MTNRKVTGETIFQLGDRVAPLSLIALSGMEELGQKINDRLVGWAQGSYYERDTFLVEAECPRFSSSCGSRAPEP